MKKYLFFIVVLFSLCSSFAQDGWFYLDAPITGNSYGALYPINENLVHIVTDDGIMLKTEDGGETWTTFVTGVQGFFYDIAFYGSNLGMAVGSNGTILRTTNGGQTWTSINSGTSNDLFSIAFTSSSEVWITGANGTLLYSSNSGSSWVVDNSLTGEDLYSIRFKDANVGLLAGANGTLFSTANGGANWNTVTIATSFDLFSIIITDSYFRVVDSDGYIFYESDDLIDWDINFLDSLTYLSSGFTFFDDYTGFYLWSDACLCDVCYLEIYKTIDGGISWVISLKIQTNAANCIHNGIVYSDIKFVTEEVGYVLYGNKLFKTKDGGTYTFLDVDEFLNEALISIYPNPTEDILNIHINEALMETKIVIRDLSGKKVFAFSAEENTTTIDVSRFKTGMYFVQFMNKDKVMESKKFIKR